MAKITEKHRREQLARIQRAIDEFYYNTYGFGELGIACEKAFEALIEKERGELVRVVRCKDCVHWTESQTSAEYGICEKDAPLRWSDFWCAEAEKREVDNGSV